MNIEDWIHRVGRTGRKTKTGYNEGKAISFFTSKDFRLSSKLIKLLEDAKQPVPVRLKEYARMPTKKGKGGGRSYGGYGGRGGGITGSNNVAVAPRRY